MDQQIMEPSSKRVKRLFKEPNPLFTKWLTEWKEDAEFKGSQMKYSYRRALKSLRQYPLPLTSGASCNILKGFGTALCAKLDKQLQLYIGKHGRLPHTGHPSSPSRVQTGTAAPRQRKPARKRPATQSTPADVQQNLTSASTQVISYRPRPGSGAYAVLVTLRQQDNRTDFPGFMHKQELQEAAQPLCTASFTVPENGSYYTAWSSTSTLIKRSLMQRQGNPGRFSLTPEGRALADRLIDSPAVASSQKSCYDRLQSPINVASQVGSTNSATSRIGKMNGSHRGRSAAPRQGSRHHEISSSGSDTDDDGLGPLSDRTNYLAASSSAIPKRTSPVIVSPDLKRPPSSFVLNVAPPSPELEDLPSTPTHQMSSEPARHPTTSQSSAFSSAEEPIVLSSDEEGVDCYFEGDVRNDNASEEGVVLNLDAPVEGNERVSLFRTNTIMCPNKTGSSSEDLQNGTSSVTSSAVGVHSDAETYRPQRSTASAFNGKDLLGNNRSNNLGQNSSTASSRGLTTTVNATATSSSTAAPPMFGISRVATSAPAVAPATIQNDDGPTVVLFPGTFDVILCVDNQETAGKKTSAGCLRTSRDVILDELQKNGVELDVRKLSVGDFLWVARPRDGRPSAELVLPYLIERKRLDDLAQSIRGSRYHEQKFRLKRCHLPNIIYLAESVGSGPRAAHLGLPAATLQQALVNCQVTDNFLVKHTGDQRETAAFLTLMTRRLQRQYQSCRLQSCRPQLLSSSDHTSTHLLLKFATFNRISAKRQTLTASDMFAKMLIQASGMSADRAAAVVSRYPTVQCLLAAYSGVPPTQAELLLSTVRTDVTGKPLGVALSKTVYHLLCDPELE